MSGEKAKVKSEKERPIIFNTDMVKAILDGRKTQTRRVIKPQPEIEGNHGKWRDSFRYEIDTLKQLLIDNKCPYGNPGDLLYVRETWKPVSYFDYGWIIKYKDDSAHEIGWLFNSEFKDIEAAEKYTEQFEKRDRMPWKPSIHMPKNASRIWLKVDEVRVERLNQITTYGIIKEGIKPSVLSAELEGRWRRLWDSINADRGFSWESNPWVWVVEFEVVSTKGRPDNE